MIGAAAVTTTDKLRYVEAHEQTESEAKTTASFESVSIRRLEHLGPPHVIEHLVQDWFESVHSVAPILHRAHFLKRLADGDAQRDCEFSDLVISICAATIACLRRKSSAYDGVITVESCYDAVEQNRVYRPKKLITLEWCQTKYNLGVAFLLISEATAGVKYLLYHKLGHMNFMSQQLLKRLYWLVFAAQW
jgi:hypothetical protein